MSGLLATLPVQLACQLIQPNNSTLNNFTPDSQLQVEPKMLPSSYTTFPEIGVAYKFYNRSLPWNLARKHCIAQTGNLAVVDSLEKIDYIMGLREQDHRIHLGMHRLFDNIQWVNVETDEPVPLIPWKLEELGVNREGENCAVLERDGSGVASSKCGELYPFICEISLIGRTWLDSRSGFAG